MNVFLSCKRSNSDTNEATQTYIHVFERAHGQRDAKGVVFDELEGDFAELADRDTRRAQKDDVLQQTRQAVLSCIQARGERGQRENE